MGSAEYGNKRGNYQYYQWRCVSLVTALAKAREFFGIEVAEPQTFSLQEYMPGKRDIWKSIVEKYGLKPYDLEQLVQWGFGDFIFNVEYDAFQDVNKARRLGFQEMNGDSLGIFLNTFKQLQTENIIPSW